MLIYSMIHFNWLQAPQLIYPSFPSLITSLLTSGAPHLDFSKGIHDEHCVMWGFNVEFTTSNYGLTTTPQREYEISTGKQQCREEDMKDKKGKIVRVIRRIEELRRLKLCRKARLTDDEILAVVRVLNVAPLKYAAAAALQHIFSIHTSLVAIC